MIRLLVIWLINAAALFALPYVLTSIHVASFGAALVAALVLGLVNTLIRPVLVLLTLPVLLVSSDHDGIFPPAAIREVAALIPGAEFRQLPTAGHSPYFETPAAFNQVVLDFLGRHVSP